MKRFILSASATLIALLCSISCAKPLQGLDPKFPEIEGNEVNINPGELLSVKITLNDVRGNAIEAVAVSTNEAYGAKVTLATDGESGKVEIQAPAYILDETSFDVNVTVTDKANARTSKTTLKVKPIKSSYRDITDPANCFVATPGELVKFPACKGCSTEKVKFDKLSLLWQDIPGLVADIVVLDGGTNLVAFKEGLEGNAVIAAKDAQGKVQWSWHFWVCNEKPKDVTAAGVTFMDRNIGTLTTDFSKPGFIGTVYQWGRKDAFAGVSETDGTLKPMYGETKDNVVERTMALVDKENMIDDAIANPTTIYYQTSANYKTGNYSWISNNFSTLDVEAMNKMWNDNGKKTVADPCPAGYMVATVADWTAVKTAITDPVLLSDTSYKVPEDISSKWAEKYVKQYSRQVQFRGSRYGGLTLLVGAEISANSEKPSVNGHITSLQPNATIWTSGMDPDYKAGCSYSNFRAVSVKSNSSWNSTAEDILLNNLNVSNKLNLGYELPVRCVKVK